MPARHLPVLPDLDQLRHQARDLLRALRDGDPSALADLAAYHPTLRDASRARLADAQLVLARSYQVTSWPRLVHACELAAALWHDDAATVRRLVTRHPALLHENVHARPQANWGPPMSYAANLAHDELIRLLHELGARDHAHAAGRAALQGHVETARLIHRLAGSPPLPAGSLGGPAYTLSAAGTAFCLSMGARAVDDAGRCLAPVDVVLETDSRKPEEKHAILEMYVQHGVLLPDTPAWAVHRGRVDLLERHLARDPGLLRRTFAHEEVYPPEFGCHDEVLATHGTPLAGATLLHLCVDYDEWELAQWLVARGMDVDARAAVDAEGFGGHTALFGTVVSQPNFWMNRGVGTPEPRFTELLLARGADPNARASLRKRLHPGYGDHPRWEYRDVTPRAWGERFGAPAFVSAAALARIRDAGGGA